VLLEGVQPLSQREGEGIPANNMETLLEAIQASLDFEMVGASIIVLTHTAEHEFATSLSPLLLCLRRASAGLKMVLKQSRGRYYLWDSGNGCDEFVGQDAQLRKVCHIAALSKVGILLVPSPRLSWCLFKVSSERSGTRSCCKELCKRSLQCRTVLYATHHSFPICK
jgi:hypothetical protein